MPNITTNHAITYTNDHSYILLSGEAGLIFGGVRGAGGTYDRIYFLVYM